MRVFGGTFKMIIDKLKPCWDTEFANITTEKLKVVEFLMDIASFISLLPPENVVLPSLDDRLVKVFGCLCVWKPEMLQRYPELGRAVLCSYRSWTSDNFERDAIQCLLDSDKPMGGKIFIMLPSPHDYICRIEKAPCTQHRRVSSVCGTIFRSSCIAPNILTCR